MMGVNNMVAKSKRSIKHARRPSETKKIQQLQDKNKLLRKVIVGWLNWIYYVPKEWRPKPMIKESEQVLKGGE